MATKYYEASIILDNGEIQGGFIGDTDEEAYNKAKDKVNYGEGFYPGKPVKIRVAKCEYVCERTAEPKAEDW